MSRLVAILALLAGLSQLSPTSTTLLLTVAVVALAITLVRRGALPSQVVLQRRAVEVGDLSPVVLRQYRPAAAGRPQPRAPGCGR